MGADFAIDCTTHAGYEARRLTAAPVALAAIFLPSLGMLGASLTHRGDEILGLTDSVERYATRGSTMGIPLLHPWANRLEGFSYARAGRTAVLEPGSKLLDLDGNGLPIHGIVGPALPWAIVDEEATAASASLAARLDFNGHPELLSVFPYPHTLGVEVRLDTDGLTIRTTITATGDTDVPVSFGYHPYLRLPGVPRAEWRVELPAARRLVLDEQMIPTGAVEPFAGFSGELDGRVLDDGFEELAVESFALAGGGRRIEVAFLEGYPYAQVYAPAERDVVCFEPMTAPTNALASGRGLRRVSPGASLTAAFRIRIRD